MSRRVRFYWPIERELEVPDLTDNFLVWRLVEILDFIGIDVHREQVLVAYKVATHQGMTEVAKLTPRWIGRKSKYFEYKGEGEPTTYAEFKVPEGVMILLAGFITEDNSIDEVLVDVDNKVDILIPSKDMDHSDGALCVTPAMLFMPSDEVKIKLVTYDPDTIEDSIMPFGIVFYNSAGFNRAYKQIEGGCDGS